MHRRLETGPSKLSSQISARPTQDVLLALCIPQRIVYLNLLFSVQGKYHKPGTIDKNLYYSRFFTNFLRFLAYFLFFYFDMMTPKRLIARSNRHRCRKLNQAGLIIAEELFINLCMET